MSPHAYRCGAFRKCAVMNHLTNPIFMPSLNLRLKSPRHLPQSGMPGTYAFYLTSPIFTLCVNLRPSAERNSILHT